MDCPVRWWKPQTKVISQILKQAIHLQRRCTKITELETEGNITTTFASGKVNEDGTSTLGTDFEPGKVVMGTTQEENYVKYINAQQQGALTLNKAVEDTPTTTEPFTFKVNLEAPEGFTGSIEVWAFCETDWKKRTCSLKKMAVIQLR